MAPTNASNQALNDHKQKVELVKCILLKCQEQEKHNMIFNSLYSTIMFYTIESTQSVMKALNSKKRIDYKEWSSRKSSEGAAQILAKNIHDILYIHYVNDRNVLLKSDILKCIAVHFGVFSGFGPLLKEKGFIWRKVPNTTKCLLIEDPEQQARRIDYLLKIAHYREEMRPFIFVETKKVHTIPNKKSKEEKIEYVLVAASPQMGLIDISFLGSDTSMDKWLEDNVYPHLNSTTVLIYEENPEDFTIASPKPESTKKEMIEWLERNRIAHHPEMRRAELYKLIEIYGKNKAICPRDEILKAKGIDILRSPRGWPVLNYFDGMWRRVELLNLWKTDATASKKFSKKFLITDQFLDMINMFTIADDWQSFHKKLNVTENEIFERDMELEEVIDKLLTMAKHEDLSEILLSESSDVEEVFDKYDCIITDKWKDDNDDDVMEVFLDD